MRTAAPADMSTMSYSSPTDAGLMSDAERAALAKEMGYLKIGKELPDGVTLNTIVQSMPKEVGGRGYLLAHAAPHACKHAIGQPAAVHMSQLWPR